MPLSMRQIDEIDKLPERFWSKIDFSENGCWLWTGAKISTGYGALNWQGQVLLAHRVSYSALVGPIPEGLTLDHLCRVITCVNPDHLDPTTTRENTQRGGRAIRTHCPKGHPYNKENTYRNPNTGWRLCRVCRRERRTRIRAGLQEGSP